MIKVRNGKSVSKKEIELFPQALIKQPLKENSTIHAFNKKSWNDTLAYIEKDILVSFHGAPNRELGAFFRDYEIPEPCLMWVCLADVAKEFFNVCNQYLSYQMMSDLLGVELKGNARNLPAMIRAEFVVECAKVLFSNRPLESRHVQIADFSLVTSNQSTTRKPVHGDNEETSGQAFAGKTFVVTGKLVRFKRDEIEQLIKDHGGHAAGSVSKKTDYVIAGEDAGSKLQKARELGVPVLSEDEFLDMLPDSSRNEVADANDNDCKKTSPKQLF